jgi:hypothetical protein
MTHASLFSGIGGFDLIADFKTINEYEKI